MLDLLVSHVVLQRASVDPLVSQRKLLDALLEIESVPDGLFEAMLQNPQRSIEAFKTAPKMSFRGTKPVTVHDWGEQIDFLDREVFRVRDG